MFSFFCIIFNCRYRPDLSGAVFLASRHLVVPHHVILVSFFLGPVVFASMITHYMGTTLLSYIPVETASPTASPISFVLRTASSLAGIICVYTVVPTSYIILMCILRPCSILNLHCLYHCFNFLLLCGQLLLGVLHRVGHMIYWCFNDRRILCRDLFRLQDFPQP